MSPLTIRFLNVGHGDCTIIEFPSGNLTMVDINNSKVLDEQTASEVGKIYGVTNAAWTLAKLHHTKPASILAYESLLTDPVDFFLAQYGRTAISRFILTHPDMDHMTGLYRLFFAERIPIANFWDTVHSVSKSEDPKDWEGTQHDVRDWLTYKTLRNSTSYPKALFVLCNYQNNFYAQDGIRIWAPCGHQSDITEDDKVNQLSYIILIEYGKCRVLLGGDAETAVWAELYKKFNGVFPKINLLKAPHHGRKSGYHWQSVKAMSPDYTVVSVGEMKKKDDALASYERWSVKGCFTTRYKGDITATCWEDGDVWLYDQNGARL